MFITLAYKTKLFLDIFKRYLQKQEQSEQMPNVVKFLIKNIAFQHSLCEMFLTGNGSKLMFEQFRNVCES